MLKKILLFFLFICYFSLLNAQTFKKIVLNENWKFSESETHQWLPAKVPGSVYKDLYNNKIIDVPFYACNDKNIQWIESKTWEYHTIFQADDNLLKNNHVELVCEGLDTYAKVYVNQNLVFTANNMFCQWSADIKNYLIKGNNELKIVFEPIVLHGKDETKQMNQALPTSEQIFARKVQFRFLGEYSTEIITTGIWRPIYLNIWNNLQIEDVQLVQNSLSKEKAELTLKTQILSDTEQEVVIKIEGADNKNLYALDKFSLNKGSNNCMLNFSIINPILWWVHNLGNPHFYKFLINIYIGKQIIASKQLNFGLRTIEIKKENYEAGESVFIKINGEAVFLKGSNYVPQNIFLSEISERQYKKIISLAKESNVNMLRVCGGGVYENDVFYELCDKYGILVLQDFMFTSALYTNDSVLVSGVKKEIEQNIKRLRNHPCIALWGVNTNSDEISYNKNLINKTRENLRDNNNIRNKSQNVFYEIIPGLVNSLDSGRMYFLFSSSGNEQTNNKNKIQFQDTSCFLFPDYEKTETFGELINYSGFWSFPEKGTLLKMLEKKDLLQPFDTLKYFQKNIPDFNIIKNDIVQEYKLPENIDEYIYFSQLAQAYKIKSSVESGRSSTTRVHGVSYWQLNDFLPAASWSGIDYFYNKKALHFFIKKSYNDVLISLENKDKIFVYVTSDKLQNIQGELELKLIDFKGNIRWEEKKYLTIKACTTRIAEKVDKTLILGDASKHGSLVMTASVFSNGKILSQNFLYFKAAKDLLLENPGITYNIIAVGKEYEITLSAKKLAKNVFISFENCDSREVELSDNFFDMMPGSSVSISVKTLETLEDLKKAISVKSLFDYMK